MIVACGGDGSNHALHSRVANFTRGLMRSGRVSWVSYWARGSPACARITTGSNRTPNTYNLDLGAYYPISLGENKQLRFQVDWFNVFNKQDAIKQDETFLINSGAPGINPVPNPFYGTGTIFQFPSALRLGVKFQF